jgi:hypothetical protein
MSGVCHLAMNGIAMSKQMGSEIKELQQMIDNHRQSNDMLLARIQAGSAKLMVTPTSHIVFYLLMLALNQCTTLLQDMHGALRRLLERQPQVAIGEVLAAIEVCHSSLAPPSGGSSTATPSSLPILSPSSSSPSHHYYGQIVPASPVLASNVHIPFEPPLPPHPMYNQPSTPPTPLMVPQSPLPLSLTLRGTPILIATGPSLSSSTRNTRTSPPPPLSLTYQSSSSSSLMPPPASPVTRGVSPARHTVGISSSYSPSMSPNNNHNNNSGNGNGAAYYSEAMSMLARSPNNHNNNSTTPTTLTLTIPSSNGIHTTATTSTSTSPISGVRASSLSLSDPGLVMLPPKSPRNMNTSTLSKLSPVPTSSVFIDDGVD